MMRCQCIKKTDGHQCTRKASKRDTHLLKYCWQHQKCLKHVGSVIPDQKPISKGSKTTNVPKVPKSTRKPSNMGFFQNNNHMIIMNPKMRHKNYKPLILDNVAKGLWDIKTINKSTIGPNDDPFISQIEFQHHDIRTNLCEWKTTGRVTTVDGWIGAFENMDDAQSNIVLNSKQLINKFTFGVYINVGLKGDFIVKVCRDVNNQIVAVRISFDEL